MDELEKCKLLIDLYEEKFGVEAPSLMAQGDIESLMKVLIDCLESGKPYIEKHPF